MSYSETPRIMAKDRRRNTKSWVSHFGTWRCELKRRQTRKGCLNLGAEGANGGKAKWDEIEAVIPASAGVFIPFSLLHRWHNRGSVSRTTSGARHTLGVIAPRVEDDVSRSSQPRAARLNALLALEVEVGGLHHVGNTNLAEEGATGLLHEINKSHHATIFSQIQFDVRNFVSFIHSCSILGGTSSVLLRWLMKAYRCLKSCNLQLVRCTQFKIFLS